MTREEARAVSFVGVLLLLAIAARVASRPKPITITAGPIDISALRAAGQAMQQAQPARAGRHRGTTTRTVNPPREPPPKRRDPLYSIDEPPPPVSSSGPLNLNRATAEELDKLPGVGPAMARRILARRDSMGRFSSIEDLDPIKGIGPALLKKLGPLVVVR